MFHCLYIPYSFSRGCCIFIVSAPVFGHDSEQKMSPSSKSIEVIEPKVTVCVITFNQSSYIEKCLQSLVMQKTDFPFEIIVADDCSTDGTREIIEKFAEQYPDLIRTIFQPINTGGSRNNLEVHAAARGDYVAHLDGDDYALPGKLQAQVEVLENDQNCTVVWHLVDYFNDYQEYCEGTTADFSFFRNGKIELKDALRLGFIGVYSSIMYRRSARTILSPDRIALDLYLTWDLMSKGHGYMVSSVYGRYRVASSGSISVTSKARVNKLAIEHANEFASNRPNNKADLLVWAICRAIVEMKNFRFATFDFFVFAWSIRGWISPIEVFQNLSRMRRTQVQWTVQRRRNKNTEA
jgi:glycosyltransferase involved in cell wall biosynthesis